MISVQGGHNNWWTWNLEVQLAPAPSLFRMDLRPGKSVQTMSFQDAADYTARCISDKFSNLYLALGGGLDSEFVANVLVRNKISFTPVVAFVRGSRNVDFHYALNWCDQNSISPVILELNQDDPRVVKQSIEFTKRFQLKDPLILALNSVLNYIHDQGGHALTGDPSIGYTDLDENFYQGIGDTFEVWCQEFLSSVFAIGHPGAFFFYTPELVAAQARELDTTLNDSRSRAKLYQIPFRPKTWPPQILGTETKNKIYQILDTDKYSIPNLMRWSKADLLKIFE